MIATMTDTVLGFGASNLAVSAAIAALAWFCQQVLRSPALAHVLWILVLAKLLTPPLIGVPVLPLAAEAENVVAMPIATPVALGAANDTSFAVDAVAGEPTDESIAATIDWASVMWWLAAVWFLGSAFVLVATTLRIRRFDRLLRIAAQPAGPAIQQRARRLASRLGLARTPTILLTPANVSPMVWWVGGAVRIYLPADLPSRISGADLHWVLAHELAHVRRRDHLVRWLEWLACVAFWWNPIAWWARRNLRQNEEVCCDALVLRTFSPTPKTYANSLLTVVEFLAKPAVRPPAMASEIDSGGFLERRFRMIVGKTPIHSTPRWLQVTALLITTLALPLGLASAQEPDVKAVGARIKQAVKAGELTPAQARTMMRALQGDAGKQDPKKDPKKGKKKAKDTVKAGKVRRVRIEEPEEIEEIEEIEVEAGGVEVEVEIESPRVSIEIEVGPPEVEVEEIEVVEEVVEDPVFEQPRRVRERLRTVERDAAVRERMQRERDVRRDQARARAAERRDRARVERDTRQEELKRRADVRRREYEERKKRATEAKEKLKWRAPSDKREAEERKKRDTERKRWSEARKKWNSAVGLGGGAGGEARQRARDLAELKRRAAVRKTEFEDLEKRAAQTKEKLKWRARSAQREAEERKKRDTERKRRSEARERWNSAIGQGRGEGGQSHLREREIAEMKRAVERQVRAAQRATDAANEREIARRQLQERARDLAEKARDQRKREVQEELDRARARLTEVEAKAKAEAEKAEQDAKRRPRGRVRRSSVQKPEADYEANYRDAIRAANEARAASRIRSMKQQLVEREAEMAERQAELTDRASRIADLTEAHEALAEAVKAGKIDEEMAAARFLTTRNKLEAAQARIAEQKAQLDDVTRQHAELRKRYSESAAPARRAGADRKRQAELRWREVQAEREAADKKRDAQLRWEKLDKKQIEAQVEAVRRQYQENRSRTAELEAGLMRQKELEAARINAENKAKKAAELRGKRRSKKSAVR